jgi:general secretion pathway protein L
LADWLLLRMPSRAGASSSWLLADAHGMSQSAVENGTLAQAAAVAGGRRVCVLVPATEVLLAEVTLPVKGGARALQAVPFALEEQLVGDIELQHFALGPRDADSGRAQVAVVTRAQMDEWLAALAAAGIEAELVCSEAALLPANPSQALVLLDQDNLMARPPGLQSLATTLPALPLDEALQIAFAGQPLDELELLLYATDEAWSAHHGSVGALQSQVARLAVQQLKSGLLPWLALQLPGTRAINLLQGGYARKEDQQALWRRWRLAASLAAALVLLTLAGQAWSLWRVGRAEQTVDAALGDVAAQIFSGDRNTRNLRRRAAQLLGSQGDTDLLLLRSLQGLAGAVGNNATIQALAFRDGRTELRLKANDAQAIERIITSLKSAGWKAELVAGNGTAAGYEGRLQVQPAGGHS